MTQANFATLTPAERAAWLDEASFTSPWKLGDDVFCLHCDGVFKAEDIACSKTGLPTCPICHDGGLMDFKGVPWWREDLMSEDDDGCHWIKAPITAETGKPKALPPRPK